MTLKVTFVDYDDAKSQQLAASIGRPKIECRVRPSGPPPPKANEADLVVIGPDCATPVKELQQWVQSIPSIAALVYVNKKNAASVQTELAMTPRVGRHSIVAKEADSKAFVKQAHKAVKQKTTALRMQRIRELL